MMYNETREEMHIDKQSGINLKSSNNHHTDEPDISLDKRRQEILRNKKGNKRYQGQTL